MAYDWFFPCKHESIALAYVEHNGTPHCALDLLYAARQEAFAGTDECFARINVAGQTLVLESVDSIGANSRRAYKNISLYLSGRP